jgi:hypothetical protein
MIIYTTIQCHYWRKNTIEPLMTSVYLISNLSASEGATLKGLEGWDVHAWNLLSELQDSAPYLTRHALSIVDKVDRDDAYMGNILRLQDGKELVDRGLS